MTTNTELRDIKVEFIPPKKWYQRAMWRLLEEYESDNGNILVPEGFVTDGASIPPLFRGIFSPTGRYFGAAIIHDYILESSEYYQWELANIEFEVELEALRVVKWQRVTLVAAVRFWSWTLKLFKRRQWFK